MSEDNNYTVSGLTISSASLHSKNEQTPVKYKDKEGNPRLPTQDEKTEELKKIAKRNGLWF